MLLTRMLSMLALCITLAGNALGQEKTVSFVTDPEKEGGYLIAVTKAAFERAGYQISIEFAPWVRALTRVMNGSAEGLLGAYYNRERAEKMLYSDVIGTSELLFFKLRDAPVEFRSLQDLERFKVGVITGAAYTPEFDADSKITKEPVSDIEINIRKLLAGRVDLVLEKKSSFMFKLKKHFPDEANRIAPLPPPLHKAHFYIALSNQFLTSKTKIDDFNRGLKAIKADGTFDRLIAESPHE